MGKKRTENEAIKIIDSNKKARHDYEIISSLEAGIVLLGSEVKSVRKGGINLKESYIGFRSGECFLIGCHISPYKFTSAVDAPNPLRDRKLLLNRREIERMAMEVKRGGLTIVPLKVYFNTDGRAKLEIALGKGKKLYDKREDVKRRDAEREMKSASKQGRVKK